MYTCGHGGFSQTTCVIQVPLCCAQPVSFAHKVAISLESFVPREVSAFEATPLNAPFSVCELVEFQHPLRRLRSGNTRVLHQAASD